VGKGTCPLAPGTEVVRVMACRGPGRVGAKEGPRSKKVREGSGRKRQGWKGSVGQRIEERCGRAGGVGAGLWVLALGSGRRGWAWAMNGKDGDVGDGWVTVG